MRENSPAERLYNGIIKENPTFVLVLGMCPTLAVTTAAINGIGMGLTTTVVLMMSNLFISLLRNIIPEISKRGCQGILLIVSNPVDILTYAALKISGFPENRVIGSGTVLDTSRLKYEIGEYLGVDSRSVHAFIIGEHGDSELAVWSGANVSGIDINDFCELRGFYNHKESMENIYRRVRDSAYEIIERKGATYYGVAMAVGRIAESIIRDEHAVLPVSTLMEGEYGINDLCISVPTIVSQSGAEKALEIPLDEEEQVQLKNSAKELHEVLSGLDL